jgi:putative transposase
MAEHKHLNRLTSIWITNPVFFITTCTYQRAPILANEMVANILIEEWKNALDRHGWMVGRYVIMPDHVHFFCAPVVTGITDPGYNSRMPGKSGITDPGYKKTKDLSGFMQQWKQWTSKRIIREIQIDRGSGDLMRHQYQPPIWQAEFFDHLLRSEESYDQKWDYVWKNPMRKGLVKSSDEWPWQGEIYLLTR